MINYSKMPQLH